MDNRKDVTMVRQQNISCADCKYAYCIGGCKWFCENNKSERWFEITQNEDELEDAQMNSQTCFAIWAIRNKIHQLVDDNIPQWNKLIFTRNSDVEYINSGNRYTVENLPAYDEQVIVTNGKDVWIDAFNDLGDGVWLSETDDDIDGVIAWMELPSYKEE